MQYADAPPRTARWVGVGASEDRDPAAAAREALSQAAGGRAPAGVLLFASPALDLGAVGSTAHEVLGDDVVVAGCTSAGEIAGGTGGAGRLVAVALGGDGLSVAGTMGSLAGGARTAGRDVAAAVHDVGHHPHRVLVLLADGLTCGRAELVRGAYGVTGLGIPLVGGCAGTDLGGGVTRQLLGTTVASDAAVGIAIGSDAPMGVGIGHGWRRRGAPFVVTESDGEWVSRLDDEPALDVLLRHLGAPDAAFEDPAAWTPYAVAHPLALPRPAGEEIRAVLAADYERRAVRCLDVPEGSVVWLTDGDADSVLAGTADACDEALAALGGRPPTGLIGFDCYARRALLGDHRLAEEIGVVTERFPGVPFGGFYTYGEIARTTGSRGVHNATFVLLALS